MPFRWLVAALLVVHAGLLTWSAHVHSPTYDEPAHLAAGISHWQFRRFELFTVNPPLVRMLAALPVLVAEPETDWSASSESPVARPEFHVGTDFVKANGARSFELMTLARLACIPLSLLGGYVCWRWARELYGTAAGFVALVLWCFSPNVLGHAALVKPDAAAGALGIAAAYLFWRWLKEPTWSRVLYGGLMLGLAELTKTTWIVLFALWPVLWALWRVLGTKCEVRSEELGERTHETEGRPEKFEVWRGKSGELLQIGIFLLLGLYVLNAGYGFEGTFTKLGEYQFVSRTLGGLEGAESNAGRNRFAGSWLGAFPVPLPKNYVSGIDVQRRDFEHGYAAYLRGARRQGGWWYWYLYAMSVKVPLGTWLLGLLSLFARTGGNRAAGPSRRQSGAMDQEARVTGMSAAGRHPSVARRRDEFVLLAPAVVVLVLVSWNASVAYLRYALPAFPFAFVWLSRVMSCGGRNLRLAALAALIWSVGSSLWVYPHSLSYFSELVGGPKNGHAHLLDANIDWGQDLLYLKRWIEEHPEARPLHLAYFGSVDPALAGIDFTPLVCVREPGYRGASPPAPGWYALSVNFLHGHQGPDYGEFLARRPVAMAGYSIYIYHLQPDDANRVGR